jgi:hypothetical protein
MEMSVKMSEPQVGHAPRDQRWGSVVSVVELLSSICEAVGSIPRTSKKKKNGGGIPRRKQHYYY